MFLLLSASKDSYITDKIIKNDFSASNANTGRASTLDIFKLYNESSIDGFDTTNELSRALIKFDFVSEINSQMKKTLDINSSEFQATFELSSLSSGLNVPTNFTLMLFPLSQSFDEGIGRDVSSFSDLGHCNFLTASYLNSVEYKWHASGANAPGNINKATNSYPTNIDFIVSGNLDDGNGMTSLGASQTFIKGTEDLSIDVTKIVSATVAGIIPDCGWRLSFTGSQENDDKTRFVKRFASRHTRDRFIRPKLKLSWDDSIVDQHEDFYFDLSGSLFLKNFHRGNPANIVSGSALTQVTGTDCMILTLRTGSYSKVITASQYQAGTKVRNTGIPTQTTNFVTGVYQASFAIPSNDSTVIDFGTTLSQMVSRTGSITFEEYWSSLDGTVGFYTGSVNIERINRTGFNYSNKSLDLIVVNSKQKYTKDKKALFKVFVKDFNAIQNSSRIPISIKSVILNEVYYRIKDIDSNDVYIPFKKDNNGTRLSSDSTGLFFETYLNLPRGRSYTIDFLVVEDGIDTIYNAKNVRFKVE